MDRKDRRTCRRYYRSCSSRHRRRNFYRSSRRNRCSTSRRNSRRTTCHTRSRGFVRRCGQECSGNVSKERGQQAASGAGGESGPAFALRAGRLLELPPIAWAVDFRLVRREGRVVLRWEPPAAGGGEHCEDERVAGVDHCSRFAFSFLLNAHSAHSRVMQAGGLRLGGRQAAGRHDHGPSANSYSPSPNPSPARAEESSEHARRQARQVWCRGTAV